MKELCKNYWEENKIVLGIYAIVTLIFYVINFIFFRNHMDAPVDAIFAFIYIIFTPGIVVLATMYRSYHIFDNNVRYFQIIIVHLLGPIIISAIFILLYGLFHNYFNEWMMLQAAHGGSVPVGLLGVMLGFEFKYVFRGVWIRLGILVGVIVSYFILLVSFDSMEYLYVINIIHIIYIFVLPIVVVSTWYRHKCLY